MYKVTEWSNYLKGEVTCYSYKINRVQAKITEQYFINNFVDHVMSQDGVWILRNVDKIVLIGSHNNIALYPKDADDISVITTYLESIKDTDIHTILISVVENDEIFPDTANIDEVLMDIKSACKMQVRYVLQD